MAIKMVREPSETPNINNIDDIIPMRYAYGGQNGYVIGKGNEISNTVNGLNFTVNSGRLVLQGVECDIDATGVTITIDNIATKRYYTVYLEVNLGLNTATIKDEYDTATYPTIDVGNDLTENTTGIARLPLYQFTAASGIISEVNKVVESIKYTNDILIKNSINTQNIVAGGTIASDVKATTQNIDDNSLKVATTEFVQMLCENVKNIIYGNIGVSTSYTSISQNQVKRQVNFVIGQLVFEDSNATLHSTSSLIVGEIPEGFRPKNTVSFNGQSEDWIFSGGLRPHVVTINPNGQIIWSSKDSNGAGGSAIRAYSYSVSFAYEIE